MSNYIKVSKLVEEMPCWSNNAQNILYADDIALNRKITTADTSRPGLELTGFFEYFSTDRIQIIGNKEASYIKLMTKEQKYNVFNKLLDGIPLILISRGLELDEVLLEIAKEKHVAVLSSQRATTKLISLISSFLGKELAHKHSVHGVLMEIYGLGLLIQGVSGIGKSETALDLVSKGHILIADDRVDIWNEDELTLHGEAPEILKNTMELRGVGIIDVLHLFGASSVKESVKLELIIYLENYDNSKAFDRLGNQVELVDLVGVKIPQIRIPVKTGRNIATIIETAAMNYRAKIMGFDATASFNKKLTELIARNSNK